MIVALHFIARIIVLTIIRTAEVVIKIQALCLAKKWLTHEPKATLGAFVVGCLVWSLIWFLLVETSIINLSPSDLSDFIQSLSLMTTGGLLPYQKRDLQYQNHNHVTAIVILGLVTVVSSFILYAVLLACLSLWDQYHNDQGDTEEEGSPLLSNRAKVTNFLAAVLAYQLIVTVIGIGRDMPRLKEMTKV